MSDPFFLGLIKYRADVGDMVARNALAWHIDLAVKRAVKGYCYRAPALRPHQDDLAMDSWARLLREERTQGQLLASYDLERSHEGNRPTLYSWIRQGVVKFAVQDFWRDNKDRLGGIPFDIRGDDDHAAEEGRLPPSETIGVRETPLRESRLRVRSLVERLMTLSKAMEGQGLHDEAICWRAWLAIVEKDGSTLAVPKLFEATQRELSESLDLSQARISRSLSSAFDFMRNHPSFPQIVDEMVPNRFRANTESDLVPAMRVALQTDAGKDMFRELVQTWMQMHIEATF